MHVLIIGGSQYHLGGVEAFCERSMLAVRAKTDWQMHYVPASTAYLNLKRSPLFLKGLGRLIRYRFRNPDYVWIQYVNLPDLAYLLFAKAMGMRVMVTPHLGSNWRSQSNPTLRSLSGKLLSLANKIALISKTQEQEINLPGNVPRYLIRNFLPKHVLEGAVQTPTRPDGVIQLIHSGRLSEGKGTYLFIEVCRRLKAANVPFLARITGGADQTTLDRVNGLISEYKLVDEVLVLGRVDDDVLLGLLRASDVLVHLSKIDSYPLIVLEAMASSVFPLCMDLAGARDMIQTYDGHIVGATRAIDESVAFLQKINLCELRKRGQAVAQPVRTDYSWDHCATALISALSSTPPPSVN